ncbi:hypothetical protein LM83088_240001 [Listeria monocytogenes]|nr:hypothetical protein LM83088_240001 [Listeria monocytogenes]
MLWMNGAITESWRKEKILRVLELCYFECYQNHRFANSIERHVLELCYFECYQNYYLPRRAKQTVLELCYFECYQNK